MTHTHMVVRVYSVDQQSQMETRTVMEKSDAAGTDGDGNHI